MKQVPIDYNIVDIDDMCVNSILLLNAKGYITRDCCSGHYKSRKYGVNVQYPYIGFLKEYFPPNLPPDLNKVSNYGENNEFKGIYFKLTNPKKLDIKLLWDKIFLWVQELPINLNYLYEIGD